MLPVGENDEGLTVKLHYIQYEEVKNIDRVNLKFGVRIQTKVGVSGHPDYNFTISGSDAENRKAAAKDLLDGLPVSLECPDLNLCKVSQTGKVAFVTTFFLGGLLLLGGVAAAFYIPSPILQEETGPPIFLFVIRLSSSPYFFPACGMTIIPLLSNTCKGLPIPFHNPPYKCTLCVFLCTCELDPIPNFLP
ncbi:hypothetical protein OUZ56_016338 [Daphnia magna]|uniref:Uncharacterized protein n=1 Tax=Daphnia magna TaxID=35525 RepID=A0ABR0AQS8_9CRUS|nr:hypothetical protein OUZ56_016338 [Daphnia magna]